jgi:hypothetical protein
VALHQAEAVVMRLLYAAGILLPLPLIVITYLISH